MAPQRVIIDCNFSLKEVLIQRQQIPAPSEILERQKIVVVTYYSFDENLHQGQIVIDQDLVPDVEFVFEYVKKIKFPIKSVMSFVDRKYMSDEEKIDSSNNSSAFNYRTIANTTTLSNHAFGQAIDINPFMNPYVKNDTMIPKGASYNKEVLGTFTHDCQLLQIGN